jgi:hypothetical protein
MQVQKGFQIFPNIQQVIRIRNRLLGKFTPEESRLPSDEHIGEST